MKDGANRKRILLYANVDQAHAGGVQAMMHGFAAFLVKKGHSVSCGWAENTAPAEPVANGWSQQFPVRRKGRRWFHVRTGMTLFLKLLRVRPHVVNIHYASPSARYLIVFRPLFGYRILLTCHGSDVLRALPHDAPHLPAVVAGADAVSAVSNDIRERLLENDWVQPAALRLVPNGVDTDFWKPVAPPVRGHATKHIVALGRLEHVKGFDILIEAMERLINDSADIHLTIIGEGAEGVALTAQANQAGIADRVAFAGRLSPVDVREHFRRADVFAMSSRSEGMPLALLEAMASGLPCVASRVGGIPEMGKDAVAFVNPEDASALAQSLATLLGNEEERTKLGRRARERSLTYCVKRTHEANEALMLQLCEDGRSRSDRVAPGLADG